MSYYGYAEGEGDTYYSYEEDNTDSTPQNREFRSKGGQRIDNTQQQQNLPLYASNYAKQPSVSPNRGRPLPNPSGGPTRSVPSSNPRNTMPPNVSPVKPPNGGGSSQSHRGARPLPSPTPQTPSTNAGPSRATANVSVQNRRSMFEPSSESTNEETPSYKPLPTPPGKKSSPVKQTPKAESTTYSPSYANFSNPQRNFASPPKPHNTTPLNKSTPDQVSKPQKPTPPPRSPETNRRTAPSGSIPSLPYREPLANEINQFQEETTNYQQPATNSNYQQPTTNQNQNSQATPTKTEGRFKKFLRNSFYGNSSPIENLDLPVYGVATIADRNISPEEEANILSQQLNEVTAKISDILKERRTIELQNPNSPEIPNLDAKYKHFNEQSEIVSNDLRATTRKLQQAIQNSSTMSNTTSTPAATTPVVPTDSLARKPSYRRLDGVKQDYVRATASHFSTHALKLNYNVGDDIIVVEKFPTGWWKGKLNDEIAYFQEKNTKPSDGPTQEEEQSFSQPSPQRAAPTPPKSSNDDLPQTEPLPSYISSAPVKQPPAPIKPQPVAPVPQPVSRPAPPPTPQPKTQIPLTKPQPEPAVVSQQETASYAPSYMSNMNQNTAAPVKPQPTAPVKPQPVAPVKQQPATPVVNTQSTQVPSYLSNVSQTSVQLPPEPKTQPPAPPKASNQVRALYQFSARKDNETSVNQGEMVEVIEVKGQWTYVKSSTGAGYVPTNYLDVQQ